MVITIGRQSIKEQKMGTFVVEIPVGDPEAMQVFNDFMDQVNQSNVNEIHRIEEELRVTEQYAAAIWYLRTRSRHTPELEQQLINMCNEGIPAPNMNECP